MAGKKFGFFVGELEIKIPMGVICFLLACLEFGFSYYLLGEGIALVAVAILFLAIFAVTCLSGFGEQVLMKTHVILKLPCALLSGLFCLLLVDLFLFYAKPILIFVGVSVVTVVVMVVGTFICCLFTGMLRLCKRI